MWEWQERLPLDLATEGVHFPDESTNVAREILGHHRGPLGMVGVVGHHRDHELWVQAERKVCGVGEPLLSSACRSAHEARSLQLAALFPIQVYNYSQAGRRHVKGHTYYIQL